MKFKIWKKINISKYWRQISIFHKQKFLSEVEEFLKKEYNSFLNQIGQEHENLKISAKNDDTKLSQKLLCLRSESKVQKWFKNLHLYQKKLIKKNKKSKKKKIDSKTKKIVHQVNVDATKIDKTIQNLKSNYEINNNSTVNTLKVT